MIAAASSVHRGVGEAPSDGDGLLLESLEVCLARAAEGHARLCPRQVLGARIGRYAAVLLGVSMPQADKRVIAFVETDGCAADGIAAATGCAVGRRTMRVVDYGKVAATFVDTRSGRAVRIRPDPEARARARAHAPPAVDDWHAMLDGYRLLPAERILRAEPVVLTVSLAGLISRPGLHVPCARCGEEVMNGREVRAADGPLCRACTGDAYYGRA